MRAQCGDKEMNIYGDLDDKRLKALLLEALSEFGDLNENFVNLIVAIFHYLGEVNAGQIGLAQGDPYSLKWEAIMAKLVKDDQIRIEQNGYRDYFLRKAYTETRNYKEALSVLKSKSYNEMRQLALYLHFDSIDNKNQGTKRGIGALGDLLNMNRIRSSAT